MNSPLKVWGQVDGGKKLDFSVAKALRYKQLPSRFQEMAYIELASDFSKEAAFHLARRRELTQEDARNFLGNAVDIEFELEQLGLSGGYRSRVIYSTVQSSFKSYVPGKSTHVGFEPIIV